MGSALTLALSLPAWSIGLLVVLFILVSLLMIMVVLIQRPQGGGLSAAFGAEAAGAGQTAFGAKTGDALTTGTILIFVLFIVGAVVLNFAIRPGVPDPASVSPAAQTAPTDGSAAAPKITDAAGNELEIKRVETPPPGLEEALRKAQADAAAGKTPAPAPAPAPTEPAPGAAAPATVPPATPPAENPAQPAAPPSGSGGN